MLYSEQPVVIPIPFRCYRTLLCDLENVSRVILCPLYRHVRSRALTAVNKDNIYMKQHAGCMNIQTFFILLKTCV